MPNLEKIVDTAKGYAIPVLIWSLAAVYAVSCYLSHEKLKILRKMPELTARIQEYGKEAIARIEKDGEETRKKINNYG